jgi:hypothetical protein
MQRGSRWRWGIGFLCSVALLVVLSTVVNAQVSRGVAPELAPYFPTEQDLPGFRPRPDEAITIGGRGLRSFLPHTYLNAERVPPSVVNLTIRIMRGETEEDAQTEFASVPAVRDDTYSREPFDKFIGDKVEEVVVGRHYWGRLGNCEAESVDFNFRQGHFVVGLLWQDCVNQPNLLRVSEIARVMAERIRTVEESISPAEELHHGARQEAERSVRKVTE